MLSRTIILVFFLQFLMVSFSRIACAQITVTAPSANVVYRAADDYATLAFQDPWDMNQWTDLGWYTFGIDQPYSSLTNINFSGGIFSATSTTSNPNFWLLDTYTLGSAPLGKIGSLFPIDSVKYRRFLIRMNLSGPGLTNPPAAGQSAQLLWSNNSLYQAGGPSTSNAFFTYPGWWVYSVDLPTLGVAANASWSSHPVDSLRFDPVYLSGINISVGWARLVADDPSLYSQITWTGSGPVDIFLDNDTNFANGYVGQIAGSATGNSYQFYVGGLPKGTYYVAIRPAGSTSTPAYSPGAWMVNDIPTLVFTSPSPEGSADDFATVQLNNAWDMNALSDIDYTINAAGLSITNIAAQDEAGNPLGNVRVFAGTTSQNFGDPEIFPLWWWKRGLDYRIDTNRYRILSLKWGIVGNRDINNGSIGRIIWKVNGESVENVSDDIILRHLPNANVIQNVIADMKTLRLEDPPGSPSTTGWNGLVDGFRIKPDEFSNPTNFYIQSVKLSALERATSSYTIQWNYSNQGSAAPTLQLYWDSTGSGFAGNLIASSLSPAAGSYAWNTSVLPNGTYYIYGRLMNGNTVMNQAYARWPIVVDHSYQILPTMALDRMDVWFGATNNGSTVTGPQTVQVITAPGVSWSVGSNRSFMTVSPTSGVGSGTFTISIQGGLPSPASMDGVVTVTSTGVSNSPQYVHMFLNVMNSGSTAAPVGSFDTPVNNVTGVAGNIPVTGWALDDIEILKVQIWRDPVGSESPAANGLIYIADATFVAGARPDVQTAYPNYPLNDRAGWGYMMLTNFLPNNGVAPGPGNGVYKLHAIAIDRDGHTVELGTKTISCDNAHATKPFGTIDTPGQGATVSGTIVNFGWALTQQPYVIPTDGSTIWVTVDGQVLGHPVYNQYRSDIATSFPGYANSTGAVGYHFLDTTTLTNGVHNIGWLVYDNAGRGDGIGSRFFSVLNSGTAPTAALDEAMELPTTEATGGVRLRRGYDLYREPEPLIPDNDGTLTVEMEELGRIELQLGATAGHLVLNGERHPLPPGSSLKGGVFYYQLAPGCLGVYPLVFQRPDGTQVHVKVRVHPKAYAGRIDR